jgi:cyclopropane-fatty-acyl-phospholipid synthase
MSVAGTAAGTRDRPTQAVDALHARLVRRGFDLPVRRWDGVELGPADSDWRLVVEHPWSLRTMLRPPIGLSAGEAYVFGDVDVEGSMVSALRALAGLRLLDSSVAERVAVGWKLWRLPRPPRTRRERDVQAADLAGPVHSRGRDADAVRYHYDVGNDFYRLVLDRGMVYSCAYFDEADRHAPLTDDRLERAQVRKLDLVCRKLHLQPGDRFLDIGCGWGSLVIHAVRHYGVRALGVTLSEPQAELAGRRIADAGLSDRAEVRVLDYRDVSGRFDAIASIGMFEHVGADQLETYFLRVFDMTADGGRFLNHGITTGRRDVVRDLTEDPKSFLGRYVFPDGTLVRAHVPVRLMEDVGFELLDVEQLRPHYVRTLAQWCERLERHADEARTLVPETTFRIWRAYMAGSVVGFESGDLGVVQVLGGKGWSPPWGRAHQLPSVD